MLVHLSLKRNLRLIFSSFKRNPVVNTLITLIYNVLLLFPLLYFYLLLKSQWILYLCKPYTILVKFLPMYFKDSVAFVNKLICSLYILTDNDDTFKKTYQTLCFYLAKLLIYL